MAILELSEIYSKKGEEFLKTLLNSEVTIYEKMASSDFSIEVDNKIIFYKKNTDSPISKIDRALMQYYENGIKYIESISDIILKNIPKGTKIGFEYFPDHVPNYIKYDNLPINYLILSYVKNENGIITDSNTLNKYAKLLKVSEPPILFQGLLSEEQKNKIFEYLKLTPSEIKEKYKTNSFTAFLISVANPKLTKSVLNNDADKLIPGIIFQFKGDKGKVYAKIIDPTFQEIVKKNKQSSNTDYVPIILIHMIEFMQINKDIIDSFKFKEVEIDEKYLELMSSLFNKFIKKYANKFEGINLVSSKLLKSAKFDINFDFIKNRNTLELLNYDINKDLFKLFLGSFRKKRKQISNFLSNSSIIKTHNEIVDLINNNIQTIQESTIETFSDYLGLELNESEIYEDTQDYELKSIIFWQTVFDQEPIELGELKKTPINIILGKFQPFNINHLENIKKYHKETKIPFLIYQINNDICNEIYPISSELSSKMFEEIIKEHEEIIDYKISESFEITNILINLFEKYDVKNIICNKNYYEYLTKIIQYILDHKNIQYSVNINLIEKIPNLKISSEIYNSILENDILKFRKYVPKCIYNFFDILKEKIKPENAG